MKTLYIVVLCLCCLQALPGQINYADGTLSLRDEPPIKPAAGASRKPGWGYFWEFGDGYYAYIPYGAKNKNPKHLYERAGTYTVRVYATPFYSNDAHPQPIVGSVTIPKGSGKPPVRDVATQVLKGDALIGIGTNAEDELVPGAEIQLVVHYKVPKNAGAASSGQLMIAFSDPNEQKAYGLKFAPLLFDPQNPSNRADRLYGASRMPNDAAAAPYRKDLGYGPCLVYQIANLEPGQERWFFLTLQANRTLDSTIIKRKRGGLQTTVRAVWVPALGTPKVSTCRRVFTMLPVHDPNRLTVKPQDSYYDRKKPSQLTYTVEFQNNEEGYVEGVEIEVPIPPSLDTASIQPKEWSPKCALCPPGFNPAVNRESCFKLDKSTLKSDNRLRLKFYNLKMPGRKTDDVANKYSKGFVSFTVGSTKLKTNLTRTRAKISFKNAEEPIFTGVAKTRWWQQTLGFGIGYNLAASLNNYTYDPKDVWDQIPFALWWQDARLKTGLGWGLEARYQPYRFSARTVSELQQSPSMVSGGGMLLDETFQVRCLDLGAHLRFNIQGFASAGLGAALSVPLWARGEINSRVYSNSSVLSAYDGTATFSTLLENPFPDIYTDLDFVEPTLVAVEQSDFGWLQAKQNAILFNREIVSRRNIGYVTSAFAEVGLIGNLVVGFRQDLRFYPKFYREQCVNISNSEVYLRFKLKTFKPR